MTFWDEFPGPNAGYVVERYDRYRQNPNAVDAATRAYFANWTPPTELMLKMVVILREAAEELHRGVLHLRERPQVALQHAMRAKKLENRAEGLYREALAELFQQPQVLDDIMLMLKRREVYRHLSNAADRGDEAANIISDIVVKMT
jgi:uncharacterized protein Yka (UPF0111/DUF47 family)